MRKRQICQIPTNLFKQAAEADNVSAELLRADPYVTVN